MQACRLVGKVDGLAALQRLVLHRPARLHKGGDVRDRVRDGVAAASSLAALGNVHRLVQVAGADWVDGDEGDRAGVDTLPGEPISELRRFLEHLRREVSRDGKFARDSAKVQRRGIQFHTPPSCQSLRERAVRMSRPMSRILCPGRGGDHPSGPPIAGRLKQLPSDMGGQPHRVRRPLRTRSGSCLAPGGVYLAADVTTSAGALLPHPFTLTPRLARGGLLSVALSRGSLRVAVSNHRALWSPDFPRPPASPHARRFGRPRSPGRLIRKPSLYLTCGARHR